jgi:hypothetical protein
MPLSQERKKKVNSESISRKKRSIFRRLLKLGFYLVIGFLIILTLAFIALRIFYPPEKLKKMAVQAVGNAIGGELTINEAKINLFGGFDLNGVVWQPSEGGDLSAGAALPIGNVKAKRLVFKYKLTRLLRRHAYVRTILIDSPEIEILLTEKPSGTLFPEPQDSLDQTHKPVIETQTAKVDSPQLALPLRVTLDEFEIKNAVLHVKSPNGKMILDGFLGDFSFKMQDLKLPRGEVLESDDVQVNIAMSCKDAPIRFFMRPQETKDIPPLGIHGRLNLNMEAGVAGFDDLSLDGYITLDEIELFGFITSHQDVEPSTVKIPNPIYTNIILHANTKLGMINLDEISLSIEPALQFTAVGSVEQFLADPTFQVRVTKGRIILSEVLRLIHDFLPQEFGSLVQFTDHNSAISIRDTHASGVIADNGKKPDVHFQTKIILEDVSGNFLKGAAVQNFSIQTQASGQIDSLGLNQLNINLSTLLSSAQYSPNDTMYIQCGPVELNAQARLGSPLSKMAATCSLNVRDLLGADLEGEMTVSSVEKIADIQGSGHFVLSELLTSELPNMPLESHANFDMSFEIASLDSIGIDAKLTTDSLRMPIDETLQSFPGLSLDVGIVACTDASFQAFRLDSLTATLNKLVTMRASAQAQAGDTTSFIANVHEIRVEHAGLLDWLPPHQKEELTDLELSGHTTMSALLRGQNFADSLSYTLDANVKTHNTRVDYPSKFLMVAGFNLNVNAEVSDQSCIVKVDVIIDTVRTDNLSKSVFCNNTIHCKLHTLNFSEFTLSEGIMDFPDFRAKANIKANADGLPNNPYYMAELHFSQSIPDTLEITRDLDMQGDIQLQANVTMDTNKADINAYIVTNGLNLFLPEGTRISGANGQINIVQSFDLKQSRLLSEGRGALNIPSSTMVDYQLYRSYYNESLADFSYFTIDHIEAGGYELDSLTMDLLIGNARLEIPRFLVNIYGGNFGGSMLLDLTSGDLQEAKYRFSAHLSSVNSAMLLPGTATGGEEGLINANMQFIGKGLDPQAGIDIGGYFYITEIGPKVADNFLRSLDPKGTDSGIRTTRLLINRGFKPQVFFFEAKHGYLYPTVTFKQPWYFPLKLSGGKVELPRMPIEFFLNNAMQQREKKG